MGTLPDGPFKQKINYGVSIMCFNFLSRCLSMVITYHNTHNNPKSGICVANHTSPIDALVLMCDNCYSLVSRPFNICYLDLLSIWTYFSTSLNLYQLLYNIIIGYFIIVTTFTYLPLDLKQNNGVLGPIKPLNLLMDLLFTYPLHYKN